MDKLEDGAADLSAAISVLRKVAESAVKPNLVSGEDGFSLVVKFQHYF